MSGEFKQYNRRRSLSEPTHFSGSLFEPVEECKPRKENPMSKIFRKFHFPWKSHHSEQQYDLDTGTCPLPGEDKCPLAEDEDYDTEFEKSVAICNQVNDLNVSSEEDHVEVISSGDNGENKDGMEEKNIDKSDAKLEKINEDAEEQEVTCDSESCEKSGLQEVEEDQDKTESKNSAFSFEDTVLLDEAEEHYHEPPLSPLPPPSKSCLKHNAGDKDKYHFLRRRSLSLPESEIDMARNLNTLHVHFSPDTIDPTPRSCRYRDWIERRTGHVHRTRAQIRHEKTKQKLKQIHNVNLDDYLSSKRRQTYNRSMFGSPLPSFSCDMLI